MRASKSFLAVATAMRKVKARRRFLAASAIASSPQSRYRGQRVRAGADTRSTGADLGV